MCIDIAISLESTTALRNDAILWNKKHDKLIVPLDKVDNNSVGIHFQLSPIEHGTFRTQSECVTSAPPSQLRATL